MVRQVLAALGSTFALVGAVAAVAIVGTAAVVFDRWPTPDGASPSARTPLVGTADTATDVRTGAAPGTQGAAATGRSAPGTAAAPDGGSRAPAGDGVGEVTAPTPRSLPRRRRASGAPVGGTGGRRPATGPGTTDGGPREQLAATVEEVGGTAVEGARSGGTAAGEAVTEVHAPSGASTTTSVDTAASGVQQAAEVVADALRRLPAA